MQLAAGDTCQLSCITHSIQFNFICVWTACVCVSSAGFPAVTELKVWSEQGQLWVEWTAPSSKNASEFVVEWVSGEEMDWQRESRGTRRTAIKGSGQFTRRSTTAPSWLVQSSRWLPLDYNNFEFIVNTENKINMFKGELTLWRTIARKKKSLRIKNIFTNSLHLTSFGHSK